MSSRFFVCLRGQGARLLAPGAHLGRRGVVQHLLLRAGQQRGQHRQLAGAVPFEPAVDALLDLHRLLAVEVEVAVQPPPCQLRAVAVTQAQGAAARQQQRGGHEQQTDNPRSVHHKKALGWR
jgi:hypothetical protein